MRALKIVFLAFIFAFATSSLAETPKQPVIAKAAIDLSLKSNDLKSQILSAIDNERYFDAQTISLVGLALARDVNDKSRYSFWRAYSLAQLGDTPEAQRILSDSFVAGGPYGTKIDFLKHWILLQNGDRTNFESWAEKRPEELRSRARIYLAVRDGKSVPVSPDAELSKSIAKLQSLSLQSPTTNAVLSAILPGLGHARLGRYQDAALAFALNFISIGATAELARKDLVMPAVAAGSLASLFYVGSISSAWRITKERNEEIRKGELGNIEKILFPELRLDF